MPHFHRLHVDAHAGRAIRPIRRPEPLRPPMETSAEAEIATFLRAFVVVALTMAGAAAVIIFG